MLGSLPVRSWSKLQDAIVLVEVNLELERIYEVKEGIFRDDSTFPEIVL